MKVLLPCVFVCIIAFGSCFPSDWSSEFEAPVVEYISGPELQSVEDSGTPVVFMHGMGDSGSNPGMKSIAKSVTKKFPGRYSVAVDVANALSSISKTMDDQVVEFAAAVRADPKLKDGFHAVGLSQGNLIVRAYIERYNNPPVRNFVSICGPMEGVAECPNNILFKLVCPIWKLDKYGANIAFSGYWKNTYDKKEYLEKNKFLPDINNERDTKNSTYRENMISLDNYVLVEAKQDSMVAPMQSEHHGFWDWGGESKVVPMEKSEGYQGDWIGLKTLDQQKKIHRLSFEGDHLRFSSEFWSKEILPRLA